MQQIVDTKCNLMYINLCHHDLKLD